MAANRNDRKAQRNVEAILRATKSDIYKCGHRHTNAVQYEKCKNVRYWLDGPSA